MVYTTLLPNNEEVRFLLRSSYKNARAVSFLSGILLLSGVLFIFLLAAPINYYGYGLISFSLILLLISFSPSTNKSFYSVGPKSVLLKRGFSRRVIKIKDIRELKIVTKEEAVNSWIKIQESETQTRTDLNTMDSFHSQRRMGKFISYCTVPVVFNGTTLNPYKGEGKSGLDRDGLFVLLSSKKGTLFLLSPKDCNGFVKEVEKYRSELNS